MTISQSFYTSKPRNVSNNASVCNIPKGLVRDVLTSLFKMYALTLCSQYSGVTATKMNPPQMHHVSAVVKMESFNDQETAVCNAVKVQFDDETCSTKSTFLTAGHCCTKAFKYVVSDNGGYFPVTVEFKKIMEMLTFVN
jgi:hypothetical protein